MNQNNAIIIHVTIGDSMIISEIMFNKVTKLNVYKPCEERYVPLPIYTPVVLFLLPEVTEIK